MTYWTIWKGCRINPWWASLLGLLSIDPLMPVRRASRLCWLFIGVYPISGTVVWFRVGYLFCIISDVIYANWTLYCSGFFLFYRDIFNLVSSEEALNVRNMSRWYWTLSTSNQSTCWILKIGSMKLPTSRQLWINFCVNINLYLCTSLSLGQSLDQFLMWIINVIAFWWLYSWLCASYLLIHCVIIFLGPQKHPRFCHIWDLLTMSMVFSLYQL